MKPKRQFNLKLVVFSLVSMGFLALTFLVDWLFIAGAVFFMIIGQREMMKNWKKGKF